MLPSFEIGTGYLPPGEHEADWDEFAQRFGWNAGRRRLLGGLRRMAVNLRNAGCGFFLVDGSFVTDDPAPNDFDACCDFSDINVGKVDLMLFAPDEVGRKEMKLKYFGELFPEQYLANGLVTFREFFQSDRDDRPKGVVRLRLETIT